eukprot:5681828-Lingulodinium_polyedra.AAC.1
MAAQYAPRHLFRHVGICKGRKPPAVSPVSGSSILGRACSAPSVGARGARLSFPGATSSSSLSSGMTGGGPSSSLSASSCAATS